MNPRKPSEVIACPSCGGKGSINKISTKYAKRKSWKARQEKKIVDAVYDQHNRKKTKSVRKKTTEHVKNPVLERQLRDARKNSGAAYDTAATLISSLNAVSEENPKGLVSRKSVQELEKVKNELMRQSEMWKTASANNSVNAKEKKLVQDTRRTAERGQKIVAKIADEIRNEPNRKEIVKLLDWFRSLLTKLAEITLR